VKLKLPDYALRGVSAAAASSRFRLQAAPPQLRIASLLAMTLSVVALSVGINQANAKAPASLGDDGVAIYKTIVRDELTAPEWNGHEPPKWLRFTRERVRPDGSANLLKLYASRSKALSEGQWPRNSLVLNPLAGPPEIWTFTGYNKMYAWGDEDPALLEKAPVLKAKLTQLAAEAAPFITEKRENVLMYLPDLSYQPNFEWSEVRVLTVRTRKINKGMDGQFKEWNRAKNAAYVKYKIPIHKLTYKTFYGEAQGVYLQICPYRSVRDMDLVGDASPEGRSSPEVMALMKGAVEWEELAIFYIDPAASHVTPAFATPDFARFIDPFWGVSPTASVAGVDGVRAAIALEKVPGAVREAIANTVGTGRLLQVERVTRDGNTQYSAKYWQRANYTADGQPPPARKGKIPETTQADVPLKDLPAPLQAEMKKEIKDCMKYVINLREGKGPDYELILNIPVSSNLVGCSTRKDVIYDAKGTILGVEAQLALDDVPEVPRALIKKAIGDGKFLQVEQLTKDGTILYEGRIGKIKSFYEDGRPVPSPVTEP
jgi:hypothetical protein